MTAEQHRQPSGTPKGGQFAAGTRAETGTELTPSPTAWPFVSTLTGRPVELRMASGVPAADAGLPEQRPQGWDPFAGATDQAVRSDQDGELARGVASGDQVRTLRAWQTWAEEQSHKARLVGPDAAGAYESFAAGLEHGVIALMSDKAEVRGGYVVSRLTWEMGSRPRQGDVAQARRLLTEKRTSKGSRAEWARQLGLAPSEAARRGFLTAGLVLSGTDEWWGLRADPHVMVTGA